VVFAVPSDAQAPCFYRGEAEPDCFAKCGGIDVRNPVLITNPTIRKVQALSGYIAVGVWSVVGSEPEDVLKNNLSHEEEDRTRTMLEQKFALPCQMRSSWWPHVHSRQVSQEQDQIPNSSSQMPPPCGQFLD